MFLTPKKCQSRRVDAATTQRVSKAYNAAGKSSSSWCCLKEKTVTISFRISESAFKALQHDAKKNNTSLNTLANQLFTAYSDCDRFLQKFRMVKLSSPTFKHILNVPVGVCPVDLLVLSSSGAAISPLTNSTAVA